MSMVSLLLTLSLTLRILVLLLLTLNIFHILLDMKYAKKRTFYWKKEIIVITLTNCKLKCFSFQISPPPPPPAIFVLCPYIGPGRINEILRYSIEEFTISILLNLKSLLSPKISVRTSSLSFWFKMSSLTSLILSRRVILSLEWWEQ